MFKKRLLHLVCIMIIVVIILSGCSAIDLGIEGLLEVTINKDSTANVDIDVFVNSSVLPFLGSNNNPLDDLRTNLEEQGFTTTTLIKEKKVGIHASKNSINIKDKLGNIDLGTQIEYLESNDIFELDKGWFKDTYTLNIKFDLLGDKDEEDAKESIPVGSFLSQSKFKLTLNLPIAAKTHNASRISADGKSLEWDIAATMVNPISMQLQVPNTTNIIITIAFGITFILLILYRFKRRDNI